MIQNTKGIKMTRTSKIMLSQLKLIITEPNDKEIFLKIKLPTILEYLYILNNSLTKDDIEKKEKHQLTYEYSIIEQDNGSITIENDDNSCFDIICALLNTEEIDFILTAVNFKQEIIIDEQDKNIFSFAYDQDLLENFSSDSIKKAFVCDKITVQDLDEDLFDCIDVTHNALIESYKSFTYGELLDSSDIETSILY